MHMNYPARFVLGTAGRYGAGHAWITFEKDGRFFLLEPLSWHVGMRLPQLSLIQYKPKYSMTWDGETISFYSHSDKKFDASPVRIAQLIFEWLAFWTYFWMRVTPRLIIRLILMPFSIPALKKTKPPS